MTYSDVRAAAALARRDDEEPGRVSQTVQDSRVLEDRFFVPEIIAFKKQMLVKKAARYLRVLTDDLVQLDRASACC